ncbi:uncharacterized protein LOC144952338 [Lampetra fluviatilis]
MACAVASVPAIASILEPSGDFPAWLETQGVNAEVARAMDSELGIRDYGVLRACVRDGLVRAELLAAARDRLPFGFYAVLRQVVKALQGTEPHDDSGTPRWDDDAAASSPDATTVFANAEHRSPTQMEDYGEHYYNHLSEEPRQTPTIAVDGNSPNGVAHNIKLETFEGEESREVLGGEGSGRLRWEETEAHHSVAAGTAANRGSQLAGKLLDKTPPGYVKDDRHTPAESLVPHPNQLDRQWRQQQQEQQHQVMGEDRVNTDCAATSTTASPRLPASWRAAVITAATRRRSREPGGAIIGVGGGVGIGGVGAGRGGGRRFECAQCGRRFSRSEALVFHMRTHTGERPYGCDVCGRAFSLHSNLKVHRRTHTGERPHRCDVCGRGFTHRSSWKRHQRTHDRIYMMQQLPTTVPPPLQTMAQRQYGDRTL